ncbi:unnamed protein product [Ixodes pacificus]
MRGFGRMAQRTPRRNRTDNVPVVHLAASAARRPLSPAVCFHDACRPTSQLRQARSASCRRAVRRFFFIIYFEIRHRT